MKVVDASPLADTGRIDAKGKGYGDPLAPRQAEVLRLLAEGHQPKAIAAMLGISLGNFWNHVKRAKARIGAASTVRAVVLYDRAVRP